ncbi:B3 domain-containing transcription factor VRN1-like [Euphorbia lathyris]|uniref:B3 domain-containing transcription factor VRN1-like n=1 Tax=Euphorbia lathyris TaxID=212925 RepID=UPI003313BB29
MTCKPQEDDDHSFNILGRNPKFFKAIVQDTIRDGRLAIPKKFVKMYGDCLCSRTVLKVADGTIWKMELSKPENGKYEAWLEKGWKEFSEHYSLKHGYLLLFKYEDRSNFLVLIFDTTLLEIDYPRKPNSSPNLKQNPSQLNGFIEIEDSDSENLELEGISNEWKGRRISQALEVANKFSSINPWFKVVLKSYKGQLFSVCVPFGFVKEHIGWNLETVILKMEGSKRCWPTKLNVYRQNYTARLSIGWSAFMRDNCLKMRDVCVFELVASNELKVHIFRHLPLNA